LQVRQIAALAGKGAAMSELQAHHCICMTPEQWTWLLCTGPTREGNKRYIVPGPGRWKYSS